MLDKIKVGWKEYDVKLVEPSSTLTVNEGVCYGDIDYNKNLIQLNKNYSEEQQKATLIHEVLHGISEMYSLDLSEDTVTRLGNALYSTLKQNNLNLVKGSE